MRASDPPAVPRTLHVAEHWLTGGTERYVVDLAAFLAAAGTPPELAVLKAGGPAEAGPFAAAATGVGRRGLPGVLRRTGAAVVHLHLYTSLLPAVAACRLCGVPCVAHLHMPLSEWGLRHRAGWRAAVALAGHVTAGSTDALRSAGLPASSPRATLVPAPVPVPDPPPPRPAADAGRPFTICGVGRHSREKDWPTVLDALPAVIAAADRPVRFVHAGGGELSGEFAAAVADRGLAAVVDARGPVPHADLADLFDAADLFVLPSRFEGLGLAPLEAMARGVPVVTADYPAAADYVVGRPGGETGHTFPAGNAGALAGRILWHLRNPAESAAVGRRGRALVAERFTPAATFGKLPAVYARLAAASRNSSTRSGGRNR